MKEYTYSEARQHFAEILDTARKEEVIIKRRNGDIFSLKARKTTQSPFDVPGVNTKATTSDILKAIKEFRSRG